MAIQWVRIVRHFAAVQVDCNWEAEDAVDARNDTEGDRGPGLQIWREESGEGRESWQSERVQEVGFLHSEHERRLMHIVDPNDRPSVKLLCRYIAREVMTG